MARYTILILTMSYLAASCASVPGYICPDGSLVNQGPCKLCDNGGGIDDEYVANNQKCPLHFWEQESSGGPVSDLSIRMTDEKVSATYLFGSPEQYSPDEMRAYGLVAFYDMPVSPVQSKRYQDICRAYVSRVVGDEKIRNRKFRLATVWPVTLPSGENNLHNNHSISEMCRIAVDNYDYEVGRRVLDDLEESLITRGPFLLAWAPGSDFGQDGAPGLMFDLSCVQTIDEAQAEFRRWKRDIEGDAKLYKNGAIDLERVRMYIQQFADENGGSVLSLFGVSEDAGVTSNRC